MRCPVVATILVALCTCAALPSTQAALLGYYQFEGNFDDSSGNGHHGVASGTPTIEVDPVRGNVLRIPNTGDHGVNIDSIVPYPDLPAGTSFTVMAWYKRSVAVTGNFRYIVNLGQNADNPILTLGVRENRLVSYIESDQPGGNLDQVDVYGDTVIEGGAGAWQDWHHLAVVYDRTTDWAHTYLDGVYDGSTDISLVSDTHGFSWPAAFIGRGPATSSSAVGWIDEARIYDEVLTWQQIRLAAGIAIPEPSTVGLGLLATAMLVGIRFRRRCA